MVTISCDEEVSDIGSDEESKEEVFKKQIKVGPARDTELLNGTDELPRTTVITNRDGKSLVRTLAQTTDIIPEAKMLDFR